MRKLLAGTLLVVGLIVGAASPAMAADPDKKSGKELVECVEKALSDHKSEIDKKSYTGFTNALNDCNKAPSLFTPAPAEMIWGALAFLIVAIALLKFAFPALRKTMAARADKIRGDLEGAEAARSEAEADRAQHAAQLADARAEANRILEEARQATEQVRAELLARAEADAAEIRQRAHEDARLAGRVQTGVAHGGVEPQRQQHHPRRNRRATPDQFLGGGQRETAAGGIAYDADVLGAVLTDHRRDEVGGVGHDLGGVALG